MRHEKLPVPDQRLHQRMLLRLRPRRRIDRQHQQLGLGDHGRDRMQELHPGGQGQRLRDQHRVHERRNAERDRQPEHGADQHPQRGTRRQRVAGLEHPRHAFFEGVMDGFFKRLVAELLAQPRPMPAHEFAPRRAAVAAHRQEPHDAFRERRDAVAEDAQREQRKPHHLQQDRKQEIDEIDQDEKCTPQDAPDGERNRHQRHDDDVIDADAEALVSPAGRRLAVVSCYPGCSMYVPHCLIDGVI